MTSLYVLIQCITVMTPAFTTAGPGTESNDIFETPNYGIRTTSKVNIASESDDVAMFPRSLNQV